MPITWIMMTRIYVVYRLAMVEFVETLLYLVLLGTCDSKQRRMSTVLNLCTVNSFKCKGISSKFSINGYPLLKCFLKVILPFACEKDAAKRSSGRKMVRKVYFSVGNLICLNNCSLHFVQCGLCYISI